MISWFPKFALSNVSSLYRYTAEFFHDMHAILRVHSYGPSKTFCHKRLLLTEQKFSLHGGAVQGAVQVEFS